MFSRSLKPNKNYTMIPNKLLWDDNVSPEARLIYALYREAHPSVNVTDAMLMKNMGIKSKTTLIKYRKELVQNGYATVQRMGGNVRFIYLSDGEMNPQEVRRITLREEDYGEE